MVVRWLKPEIRAKIWEDYDRAGRPTLARQFKNWAHEATERLNLPEKLYRSVAQVVVDETQLIHQQTQISAHQEARLMGELLGGGLVAALETFRDALKANKRRPLLDRSGRPARDEAGKLIWVVTEDWPSRIAAARNLAQIYGMFAPQQVQVEAHVTVEDLSDAELVREFGELQNGIAAYLVRKQAECGPGAEPEAEPEAGKGQADRRRIAGPEGDRGSMVLDARLY